ncbi:MAG TPA: ribosome silencing factor, partial [Erythrobacter sp.]|nr:ribosome silencing factor [Erythrobacter sp.]
MTQAQSIPASAGSNPAQVIDLSDANLDPLLKLVLTQLDDDQAQDIVTIDLKGKSSIADHMVIASGRSTRQVAAIAQKLAEKIKQAGFGPVKLEGLPAADWVL